MKHGHWGCPRCKATAVFRLFNIPARRLVKLETFEEDGEEHPSLHVTDITEVEVLKDQMAMRKTCQFPSCGHEFTAAKWWRDK